MKRDSDSGQNTRAGHLREDQTWSERHGTEQQMPATCFATPTFPCLRNRCFQPLMQQAGLKPCATYPRGQCSSKT